MFSNHPRSSIQARIAMHRNFWEGRPAPHPAASFRIVPDFFFSRHFKAAEYLLVPHQKTSPEMLAVDTFLPDYERMFQESEELGQDGFWTAEPYTGIPWMEAILGCNVYAGQESFTSEPLPDVLENLDAVRFDPENPWFLKYLEFTRRLVELSAGRFPIGQPITRGPSDMAGALLGQTQMIFALADEPKKMKVLFKKVTDVFMQVLGEQKKLIPPFHGGSALGFYHVYCPGTSIWYQEDLSAIMSPAAYREFLREPERRICEGCEYTAIHLHPSSFFLLDELLANPWLKAVEVNKDIGGPSVPEMLPALRKITEKKGLILWGDLTVDDLACVRGNLPAERLFFNIMAPSMEAAQDLLAFIRSW